MSKYRGWDRSRAITALEMCLTISVPTGAISAFVLIMESLHVPKDIVDESFANVTVVPGLGGVFIQKNA